MAGAMASSPEALAVKPEGIPAELKAMPRWLAWRWARRDGKWTKPPVDAKTGGAGDSTRPDTWAPFDVALEFARCHDLPGVGLALGADLGITAIDLDHCRDPETGTLLPWAQEIIEALPAYWECSPSASGVRGLVRAVKPEGRCRKDGVELYDRGRYVTITGHRLPQSAEGIPETQEALRALHARQFPPQEQRQPATPGPVGLDDATLIEKAMNAKDGPKFKRLFVEGDTSEHNGNHSSADEALMSLLRFWTGADPVRMEALFSQSALGQRGKWTDRPDYRRRTIQAAIDLGGDAYSSKAHASGHTPQAPQGEAGEEPETRLVRMADVVPEAVSWLWEPYIPAGKLTLLEGDPGVGKSHAALSIATHVSLGKGLPGITPGEPANVLLLSAEDGLGDTIRPRLDKMGADVARIFAIEGPVTFDAEGLALVESYITNVKPRLVIVDPIVAYIGAQVDLHRANETRPILARLAAIAERHGCALLAIRHLSKSPQGRAIYRGLGSIDLTAAARSVLLAGSDPEAPQTRGLVQIKSNLAPQGSAVGYAIDRERGFLWTGGSNLTAGRILASEGDGEDKSALDEATDFLREVLAAGPVKVEEVERQAQAAGISAATRKRARRVLGVKAEPVREPGKPGVRGWRLGMPPGGLGDQGGLGDHATNGAQQKPGGLGDQRDHIHADERLNPRPPQRRRLEV